MALFRRKTKRGGQSVARPSGDAMIHTWNHPGYCDSPGDPRIETLHIHNTAGDGTTTLWALETTNKATGRTTFEKDAYLSGGTEACETYVRDHPETCRVMREKR